MTACELLAIANGIKCEGEHKCVFCGAKAYREHALSETFTSHDTLVRPSSKHICEGCVIALQEAGTGTRPDGQEYTVNKSFRRMHTHIITEKQVVIATKEHIEFIRNTCLNPPEPPFVISIAISGQKHILYRGAVNRIREHVQVTLEGEKIEYHINNLKTRLELTSRLVAATGKPALASGMSVSMWFAVCDRYGRDNGGIYCKEWEKVQYEPLSRLAAFLTPKKEVCQIAYPNN